MASADEFVLGTGRSSAGQVPEDPFGFLLAGDRPVLPTHPNHASMGGGGTMNTMAEWTFVNIVYRCRTLWSCEHFVNIFVNNWRPFVNTQSCFYFLFVHTHFFSCQIKTVFQFSTTTTTVSVLGSGSGSWEGGSHATLARSKRFCFFRRLVSLCPALRRA